MADAFPLEWPEGWPRTRAEALEDGKARFRRPDQSRGWGRTPWTFAAARDQLLYELDKISPAGSVISSNFQLSRGVMTEGRRRPDDEGIAVYFTRHGKSYAMACDRFFRAEDNMRSLTLALEAMRQIDRHGGGVMMERAFAGFQAIAGPPKPHEILGVEPGAGPAAINAAWRAKIAEAHPDKPGGSHALAKEINAARTAMLADLASGAR